MSTDKSSQKGYKRINFFKGFLTTENDWNEAEKYHVEKRKLHNRHLHAPGVVAGQGGELKVLARARGDLSIEIQPGYAIDGQGNDLVLWETVIKTINPEEYRLPQTIYVVLRFAEDLTDFIAYKENLEYKGHRRLLELARVEFAQTEPDITREVELARVFLEKGATRIRDARDPYDPRPNEIDLRWVPQAGIAGSFLTRMFRMRITQVLRQYRAAFLEYARRGVLAGHDAYTASNAALMLDACNLLDMRSVFEIFAVLVNMQAEIGLDVNMNHPNIAQKKEFTEYKRHVEVLKGLIGERKVNVDALQNLFSYQAKANESATSATAGEKMQVAESKPKDEPKTVKAELKDWEGVKTMPAPGAELDLEGVKWTLIDQIEILEKESEEKHAFVIADAKDSYRSRQKLKYPDGTVVEDTGRAHVGGSTTFKILNVTPGKPICMLRRMDYVYGDYELEMHINGKVVGTVSCTGTDRVNRWRNWPFLVPAEAVTEATLTVKQVSLTAGRDVNLFHFWFYQPK